jgi:hypothetical protein
MNKREAISALFSGPLKKINPGKALQEAIENNDQRILNINRQQLDRGLDSDGNSLGRYKIFNYKNRWEPVDLKLTGAFRNKFELGVDEKKIEFFSQDIKSKKLEKKYGKKIFGVANQYISTIGEIIRPGFSTEVKNQITS